MSETTTKSIQSHVGKKQGHLNFFHVLAGFSFTKRQRFVISVIVLTCGLFFSEAFQFIHSGILISLLLSLLTITLLFWANYKDIRESYSPSIFILPFFYTLSVSLFYFLFPDRLLFRFVISLGYAIGLYSLFLSQNIFIVASIRTIALLSSARLVSTVITTVSFILLSWTVFSLHFFLLLTAGIVFFYSFFLVSHALWIYTLEKSFFTHGGWVFLLSLCVFEVSIILWFWPSIPAFLAIFLTGFFYSLIGLSHLWFEKRLFKDALWEYVWWTVIVFCILLFFTYFS